MTNDENGIVYEIETTFETFDIDYEFLDDDVIVRRDDVSTFDDTTTFVIRNGPYESATYVYVPATTNDVTISRNGYDRTIERYGVDVESYVNEIVAKTIRTFRFGRP